MTLGVPAVAIHWREDSRHLFSKVAGEESRIRKGGWTKQRPRGFMGDATCLGRRLQMGLPQHTARKRRVADFRIVVKSKLPEPNFSNLQ